MFEKRKCAFCGAEFQPTRKNHIFCCKKCSMIANNARRYKREGADPLFMIERKCLVCGNTFVPRSRWQKYCNPSCRDEAGRMRRAKEAAERIADRKRIREEAREAERYRKCCSCGGQFLPVGEERTCPVCVALRDEASKIKGVKLHNDDEYIERYTFKDAQKAYEHRENIFNISEEARKAGMSYGQYVAMMERSKNE